MTELKPCPFCGGKPKVEQCEPSTLRFNEGAVHFKVSCPSMIGEYISDCIGSHLNLWEITPEEAISKWNTRTEIDPEQEQRDKLERHNEKVRGDHED